MKLIDQIRENYENDPLDTIVSGLFFFIGIFVTISFVASCIIAIIYGIGLL